MKILFVWTGLTSYMGDCWRILAAQANIELKVVVDVSGGAAKSVDFSAEKVLAGISYELVSDSASLSLTEKTFCPEIIFSVGWHSTVCRRFLESEAFACVPKVCCFDMPWRWKLRCFAAPIVLGRIIRQYDAAFVPGVVCFRYAKWLGFKRIYTGLFAIDTQRFATHRPETADSTDFSDAKSYLLYIGRNSREKRLDDVREAYRRYRMRGGKLELRMYGKGLGGGFLCPEAVPRVMRGAAAFVLASDFDPWPLVLLEAMSAGCPIIASDRCTNRPELGKNWRVFETGHVDALAALMKEAEQVPLSNAQRQEMLEIAQQYDCRRWIERVRRIAEEVTK